MKKHICGIVGFPLKKPRSIEIWSRFFKRKKISSEMNKYEVPPRKIARFIKFMKTDDRFLATAISMPYKITLFNVVQRLDPYAKRAKSINLILKKKNKLIGFNTDIFGAIQSIKKDLPKFKNIIIIGMGGTGKALFNYLYSKYKNKKYHLISKSYSKKKNRVKIYRKLSTKLLSQKNLIINCTPLGSNLRKKFENSSPIQKNFFSYIKRGSSIFDIIYSPKNTLLSKLSRKFKLKYKNGIKMNTLQAERALDIVFSK